jgi:hypothetical protein
VSISAQGHFCFLVTTLKAAKKTEGSDTGTATMAIDTHKNKHAGTGTRRTDAEALTTSKERATKNGSDGEGARDA